MEGWLSTLDVKPVTVTHHVRYLRAYFRYCGKQRYCTEGVLEKVRGKRVPQPSPKALRPEEVEPAAPILASARRIVGDPDHSYEEPIAPWLFPVIRHAALDAYWKERRVEGALARYAREQAGAAVEEPHLVEEEPEVGMCVLDLVFTLKPEYAAVIEADLAERDPETVADELGVTPNNLKVRLHRARQQLRERLGETCRLCATHGGLDCTGRR